MKNATIHLSRPSLVCAAILALALTLTGCVVVPEAHSEYRHHNRPGYWHHD